MPRTKTSDPNTYTKPELRDKIKKKVVAGDKGGNPGQWSARKAQLVTQEYEKEGGDYKKGRNEAQKSLKNWGDEHWKTSDDKQARRPGGTTRYLPEKAWDQLTEAEKKATNRKKVKGSQHGTQFVANTAPAAKARKKAVKKKSARKTAATGTVAKETASTRSTGRKAPARKTSAKRK